MEELTLFKKTGGRFVDSLYLSIDYFRKGEDHYGLDSFLDSMYDLERLLELQKCFRKLKINSKIEEVIQKLYLYMKNKDIVGMTDELEFILYPLAKELVEESGMK